MRRPSRRTLLIAGALLAGALVFVLSQDEAPQVRVVVARRDTLSVSVAAEGQTRARDRFTVTAPVSGRLARLEVGEGEEVEAGTVLARIYPSEEDPRTVALLSAEVDAARAALAEAESRALEARLQAEQAAREVERRRPLAEMGAISAEAMEHARLAAEGAEQRRAGAEAALVAARAALRGAEARLLGARAGGDMSGAAPGPESGAAPAPGSGSDPSTESSPAPASRSGGPPVHLVRAPVSGRVLRIPDESGRVVMAGTPLLEMANTGGLELVFDVLSEDAVRILPGQPVRVTQWGGEGALSGRVRLVTGAGYTKVSALGVEEQRVDVLADLDATPPTLGTGYRVAGEIVTWQGAGVLVVPTSALFRVGEGWSLFVLEAERARLRAVTVGQRNERFAEIADGIAEAEEVIVFPSAEIGDGMRVDRVEG